MDEESTATESTFVDSGDEVSVVSGDSSFYGSRSTKKRYEKLAHETDTADYWRVHEWNVQVIAARALNDNPDKWAQISKKRKRDDATQDNDFESTKWKRPKKEESDSSQELPLRPLHSKPHNPYEGNHAALQLEEPVDEFLDHLKPSESESNAPWIYCANFKAGYRDTDANIPVFKQVGGKLLENFLIKRRELESSFDPPKPPGVITRMLSQERASLERDIMEAARKYRVTVGKWMVFATVNEVDRYWAAVVRGTVAGRLGISAKVATKRDSSDEPTQVICIYTENVDDVADIKRVLLELVRLRVAPAIPGPSPKGASSAGGQIWYKPDCYTYLDILSGNEYKIKPTLYGTSSLLTINDVQALKI